MTKFRKYLSQDDPLLLLELISAAVAVGGEEDVRALLRRMGALIPYDFAVCGLAVTRSDNIDEAHTLNAGYPEEWLQFYHERQLHNVDPIYRENFAHFRVQYWADTYRQQGGCKGFVAAAESFGLKQGYTWGWRGRDARTRSIFSIAGNVEQHPRSQVILELLAPHLHEALQRALLQPEGRRSPDITPREMEILQWLRNGKSSWEISVILGISERTVKFHVANLMRKLDAVSRSHAVAIAVSSGLIDLQ